MSDGDGGSRVESGHGPQLLTTPSAPPPKFLRVDLVVKGCVPVQISTNGGPENFSRNRRWCPGCWSCTSVRSDHVHLVAPTRCSWVRHVCTACLSASDAGWRDVTSPSG